MMYFRFQVISSRKAQRQNDFDMRCDSHPKLFISTLEKHWNFDVNQRFTAETKSNTCTKLSLTLRLAIRLSSFSLLNHNLCTFSLKAQSVKYSVFVFYMQ